MSAPRDPGLAAVEARYGPDMAERMRNWPRLAANYAEAQGCDAELIASDVAKAENGLRRARTDADFALDEAKKIARVVDRDQWAVVPSIAQLRRAWGLEAANG